MLEPPSCDMRNILNIIENMLTYVILGGGRLIQNNGMKIRVYTMNKNVELDFYKISKF